MKQFAKHFHSLGVVSVLWRSGSVKGFLAMGPVLHGKAGKTPPVSYRLGAFQKCCTEQDPNVHTAYGCHLVAAQRRLF